MPRLTCLSGGISDVLAPRPILAHLRVTVKANDQVGYAIFPLGVPEADAVVTLITRRAIVAGGLATAGDPPYGEDPAAR